MNEKGFTLIELIMVIVILGILAVTAIPKFVDLSDEANSAALDGVVGTLASASAINYAGCVALSHSADGTKCSTVDNCSDIPGLLQGDSLPAGYSVTAAALTPNGTTASCVVTQSATSNTGSFTGISAGN